MWRIFRWLHQCTFSLHNLATFARMVFTQLHRQCSTYFLLLPKYCVDIRCVTCSCYETASKHESEQIQVNFCAAASYSNTAQAHAQCHIHSVTYIVSLSHAHCHMHTITYIVSHSVTLCSFDLSEATISHHLIRCHVLLAAPVPALPQRTLAHPSPHQCQRCSIASSGTCSEPSQIPSSSCCSWVDQAVFS